VAPRLVVEAPPVVLADVGLVARHLVAGDPDAAELHPAVAFAVDEPEGELEDEAPERPLVGKEVVVLEPARRADEHPVAGRPEGGVALPPGEVLAVEQRPEPGRLDDRGLAPEQARPVEEDRREVRPAEARLGPRLGPVTAVGVAAAGDEASEP